MGNFVATGNIHRSYFTVPWADTNAFLWLSESFLWFYILLRKSIKFHDFPTLRFFVSVSQINLINDSKQRNPL